MGIKLYIYDLGIKFNLSICSVQRCWSDKSDLYNYRRIVMTETRIEIESCREELYDGREEENCNTR